MLRRATALVIPLLAVSLVAAPVSASAEDSTGSYTSTPGGGTVLLQDGCYDVGWTAILDIDPTSYEWTLHTRVTSPDGSHGAMLDLDDDKGGHETGVGTQVVSGTWNVCDELESGTWTIQGLLVIRRTNLSQVLLPLAPVSFEVLVPAAVLSEEEGSGYHQPAVGGCHQLSFKEAVEGVDPTLPVSCGRKHTTQTLEVVKLPSPVAWHDGDAIARRAVTSCERQLLGTVAWNHDPHGYSLALSSYDLLYLFPTRAERKRGAAWVRCDVVRRAGKNELGVLPEAQLPLAAVPKDVKLHRPLLARELSCLEQKGRQLYYGNCQRGGYEAKAVGAVLLHGRPPSATQARAIAIAKCAKFTGRWAGMAWTYDTGYAWRAGRHYLTCYRFTGRARGASTEGRSPWMSQSMSPALALGIAASTTR